MLSYRNELEKNIFTVTCASSNTMTLTSRVFFFFVTISNIGKRPIDKWTHLSIPLYTSIFDQSLQI